MKTKDEKLAFLSELIIRAEREEYGAKGDMHLCVQDADMFMSNCTGRSYSKWKRETSPQLLILKHQSNQQGNLKRADGYSDMQWNDRMASHRQNWNYAKQIFIDALKLCHREFELFGDSVSASSDPLEIILRQQLDELIEEARDAVQELEDRLDDIEGRIDDVESRISDIESKADDTDS